MKFLLTNFPYLKIIWAYCAKTPFDSSGLQSKGRASKNTNHYFSINSQYATFPYLKPSGIRGTRYHRLGYQSRWTLFLNGKVGLILPRARFRNSFGVVRSGKRYLPKTEIKFSVRMERKWDRKWLDSSLRTNMQTFSVAPASKTFPKSPMLTFGNHNKEYSIISSTEASFSFVALVFTFLITTSIFSSLYYSTIAI